MCYILNDREHLGKFDSKSDDDVLIGYSMNNKAYCVYIMRTQTIMSVNVVVDDANDFSEFSKKENIYSLVEESGDEVGLTQLSDRSRKIESSPCDTIATGDPVATETD